MSHDRKALRDQGCDPRAARRYVNWKNGILSKVKWKNGILSKVPHEWHMSIFITATPTRQELSYHNYYNY